MVVPVNNGLDEMMASYGIKINKDVVLDKSCTKVNLGSMIADYPLMPLIEKRALSRKSVITKYINSALFFKSSSIELDAKLKDKGVATDVLVATSPESWQMEGRMNFNPMFMNPPSGKNFRSFNIAVLASGKFDSFFKGKDAPSVKDAKAKSSMSAQKKLDSTIESGKSEILVVGSSDITNSGFINHSRRVS